MTKTVKFSALSDGETFKSAGRPNGDTFRKESDENWEGSCSKFGCENSWNALNTSDKKGELFVHFCPDSDVLVEVVEPDVSINNHGSVCMVSALTDAAKDWVNEHVHLEDWQMWGAGVTFACEPRYVDNLIDGMVNDGLLVSA
jgi:hypothetical protein